MDNAKWYYISVMFCCLVVFGSCTVLDIHQDDIRLEEKKMNIELCGKVECE